MEKLVPLPLLADAARCGLWHMPDATALRGRAFWVALHPQLSSISRAPAFLCRQLRSEHLQLQSGAACAACDAPAARSLD